MAATKLLLAGQRICLHSPRKLEAAIWLLCLSRKMTKKYFSARNQKLASEKFASEISHMISRTLTLDNENLTFAIQNSTSLAETRRYLHVNEPTIFINRQCLQEFRHFWQYNEFPYTPAKKASTTESQFCLADKKRQVAAILNHDGVLETTTKVCMNPQ